MTNNLFEKVTSAQESLSKEDWLEKLAVAEEKLNQLIIAEKNSEFYDKEMFDSFVCLSKELGYAPQEVLKLYIGAAGEDYDAMLANYNKEREFNANTLKPVKDEIFTIKSEIRKIDQQELEKKKYLEAKEVQEKFQSEKTAVEIVLYEALDKIHQEIPQEAYEVGMKTDVALKTYKPDLVEPARILEWRIKELDSITRSYELNIFIEKLKRSNLI